MTTIKDIAKITGFSPATISRVLNEDESISVKDSTRQEILKVAEDLAYVSKKKFLKKEETIGVVQWISSDAEIEDPYYSSLRLAVESFFVKEKIPTKIYYKENFEEIFQDKNILGLVCLGKFSLDQAHDFYKVSKNLVFVDFNPDEKHFHSVVPDLKGATEDLLAYLKEMGHREIGFIGGRERLGKTNSLFIDIRERTFEQVMKNDGHFIYNPIYKKVRDFDAATGYDLMTSILKDDHVPTAFICASDSLAMGALRALGDQKNLAREKISIVGYNDIGLSAFTNPPLTTVKINIKQMGDMAGTLMTYIMKNKLSSPVNIFVKTELVERESVYKLDQVDVI
ncbi:MAG: LacI family DNA-binding transcriptional regulator [Bacillota bacterium]|nr:LacI family DNA-binding transcriptional regulator [Bacillota bacterium]